MDKHKPRKKRINRLGKECAFIEGNQKSGRLGNKPPPAVKKLAEEENHHEESGASCQSDPQKEEIGQTSVENIIKKETLPGKIFSKRKIMTNWDRYKDIDVEENETEHDFEVLANVPISADGHFVFKSEKTWAAEDTKYSELFSLNMKRLAAAIDCIPFNDYIGVEEKYFTKDQLTRIHSKAEEAVLIYSDMTKEFEERSQEKYMTNAEDNTGNDRSKGDSPIMTVNFSKKETKDEEIDDTEEDLEFLLSLKEPVKSSPIVIVPPLHTSYTEATKTQAATSSNTKSIDLEKWLDSVLDD